YRLLAIAKYEDRYVIPTAYAADLPGAEMADEMGCSLSFDGGPGMYESGPFGQGSGAPRPVAVETFHALQQRQVRETAGAGARGGGGRSRVNLLNWDGNGSPEGLFPEPKP